MNFKEVYLVNEFTLSTTEIVILGIPLSPQINTA